PTQNFTPGYKDSIASASKCAEECQKVFFPSLSSQVSSLRVASLTIGRVASHTFPLTCAASTLRARPSLIDFAISSELVPAGYSLTDPSGNVIFIILCLLQFLEG